MIVARRLIKSIVEDLKTEDLSTSRSHEVGMEES